MTKETGRILIVDDEKDICGLLSHLMESEGLTPLVAYDGERALKMVHCEAPDLLLLDYKIPGVDGMEVLKRIKELENGLPVIMITSYADIHGAVKAMRAGAHDYIAKPFEHNHLIQVVRLALASRNHKGKNKALSGRLQDSFSRNLYEMMGTSDTIGQLVSEVNVVAKSNFSVIIIGESGSGKELIAQAIHQASPRSNAPFIPVDCGAIPESLLESELFGHSKGAFTGADRQKPGKFEAAQGGTLFLDEISNMPPASQAKLLRVLQEKKLYPVGTNKPVNIDIRLLVASNLDFNTAIASGSFRHDLYFRLNEFTIRSPPLRERKKDIIFLAKRFLNLTNEELNKNVKGLSDAAIESLLFYDWPGNVRQLRSTIRRAVLLAGEVITEKHLDIKNMSAPAIASTPEVPDISWGKLSLKEIVRQKGIELEEMVLRKVLCTTGGNKAKAARMLQIDYKTIHTKVKKYGI